MSAFSWRIVVYANPSPLDPGRYTIKNLGYFLALAFGLACCRPARADEVPEKYQTAVNKGLDWLVKQQHKDGHWEGQGGKDAELHTALAGLALLLEGSTVTQGKYAPHLNRAVDWLMSRSRYDGLIGAPKNKRETARALFAHDFALNFLAEAYGDEPRQARRDAMKKTMSMAVRFCAANQSRHGGWSKKKDRTDLAVTIAMVQGLRVARNAGISVPKAIHTKAVGAITKATTANGGVAPRLSKAGLRKGTESPALAAGALVCMFTAGDFDNADCKKWLAYCRLKISLDKVPPADADPYLHLYFAQALHALGEDGWVRAFSQPGVQPMTWSAYRTWRFDHLQKTQRADGSWPGIDRRCGPVFTTSVNLIVMQQDRQVLTLFR
jgi:hypothetical protein